MSTVGTAQFFYQTGKPVCQKPASINGLIDPLLSDRFCHCSIGTCRPEKIKQWHDVIGEKTIADAVLDRIVHNAGRIELKGESLRKIQNKKELASID